METTKRYLSHKTADLIMDNNYHVTPVHLYIGRYPLAEEFESLMSYVNKAARLSRTRLRVTFGHGTVLIRKA